MPDDHALLSIDFLAGMTIFMVAFIWVATMIPGLLLSLQGGTIDYDAVAYRTGVILVEDPGMPANPPWENKDDMQKDEVLRFGLSLTKDNPNILALNKIERFYCSTSFSYPDDYQRRVIFGDRPYSFNISLSTFDAMMNWSVGDVKPEGGYGYIRRLVKIKQPSNATINAPTFRNSGEDGNVTDHVFSIHINCTRLLQDERNPPYQIDPLRERIMVNISNLGGAYVFTDPTTNVIRFNKIVIYRQNPAQPLVQVRTFDTSYVDGGSAASTLPVIVNDNASVIFPAGFFYGMANENSQLYINYTFKLSVADLFFNNSFASPYDYDYSPIRVTQPTLKEGVAEVAIW